MIVKKGKKAFLLGEMWGQIEEHVFDSVEILEEKAKSEYAVALQLFQKQQHAEAKEAFQSLHKDYEGRLPPSTFTTRLFRASYKNLCRLDLLLGNIPNALHHAVQAVSFAADKTDDSDNTAAWILLRRCAKRAHHHPLLSLCNSVLGEAPQENEVVDSCVRSSLPDFHVPMVEIVFPTKLFSWDDLLAEITPRSQRDDIRFVVKGDEKPIIEVEESTVAPEAMAVSPDLPPPPVFKRPKRSTSKEEVQTDRSTEDKSDASLLEDLLPPKNVTEWQSMCEWFSTCLSASLGNTPDVFFPYSWPLSPCEISPFEFVSQLASGPDVFSRMFALMEEKRESIPSYFVSGFYHVCAKKRVPLSVSQQWWASLSILEKEMDDNLEHFVLNCALTSVADEILRVRTLQRSLERGYFYDNPALIQLSLNALHPLDKKELLRFDTYLSKSLISSLTKEALLSDPEGEFARVVATTGNNVEGTLCAAMSLLMDHPVELTTVLQSVSRLIAVEEKDQVERICCQAVFKHYSLIPHLVRVFPDCMRNRVLPRFWVFAKEKNLASAVEWLRLQAPCMVEVSTSLLWAMAESKALVCLYSHFVWKKDCASSHAKAVDDEEEEVVEELARLVLKIEPLRCLEVLRVELTRPTPSEVTLINCLRSCFSTASEDAMKDSRSMPLLHRVCAPHFWQRKLQAILKASEKKAFAVKCGDPYFCLSAHVHMDDFKEIQATDAPLAQWLADDVRLFPNRLTSLLLLLKLEFSGSCEKETSLFLLRRIHAVLLQQQQTSDGKRIHPGCVVSMSDGRVQQTAVVTYCDQDVADVILASSQDVKRNLSLSSLEFVSAHGDVLLWGERAFRLEVEEYAVLLDATLISRAVKEFPDHWQFLWMLRTQDSLGKALRIVDTSKLDEVASVKSKKQNARQSSWEYDRKVALSEIKTSLAEHKDEDDVSLLKEAMELNPSNLTAAWLLDDVHILESALETYFNRNKRFKTNWFVYEEVETRSMELRVKRCLEKLCERMHSAQAVSKWLEFCRLHRKKSPLALKQISALLENKLVHFVLPDCVELEQVFSLYSSLKETSAKKQVAPVLVAKSSCESLNLALQLCRAQFLKPTRKDSKLYVNPVVNSVSVTGVENDEGVVRQVVESMLSKLDKM